MQVFPSIYRIAWGTRDYVHTHSCEYITGVCPPAISAKDTAQQHTYGREDHETGTRDTRDQRARALTRRPRTGQQLRQGAPAGLHSTGTVAIPPVADPPLGNRATTERIRYDAASGLRPSPPVNCRRRTHRTPPRLVQTTTSIPVQQHPPKCATTTINVHRHHQGGKHPHVTHASAGGKQATLEWQSSQLRQQLLAPFKQSKQESEALLLRRGKQASPRIQRWSCTRHEMKCLYAMSSMNYPSG